ncbi:MAG: MBL fold metallo-hydrolase [Bacteroidales bacterium]|nr:MBL fold metallo-hydrolase [Bacteroidales bacterium]
MELIPLISDLWKMDGGVAFGVVPKSIWNRNNMADENNMMPIVTRCLLVRSNERLILIDAGMGNKRDEKYYKVRFRDPSVSLLKALDEIKVKPEEITDILLTHLHDDHVGGVTQINEKGDLIHVFPNATYYCSFQQWEWAIHPNKRESAAYFKDNLLPMLESGRLQLLNEETELFPGITLRIYNGHTMGQLIPFMQIEGKTYVFMGDFIPTAFNIPMPFVPSVDIQPLLTMDEKAAFMNEAADNKYILIFEHDYYNECCTLMHGEKGIVMDKSFRLNSQNYE